jgi:hypothetical protein
MIQVYNIISGIPDSSSIQFNMSNISNTRGNKFKMQLTNIHYNILKRFFSNKIIAVLNSLPNDVVLVDSTNIFKNRLDQFLINQDLEVIWSADITGIGSRSFKYTKLVNLLFNFFFLIRT